MTEARRQLPPTRRMPGASRQMPVLQLVASEEEACPAPHQLDWAENQRESRVSLALTVFYVLLVVGIVTGVMVWLR